jgi:PPM family protein phosphatase
MGGAPNSLWMGVVVVAVVVVGAVLYALSRRSRPAGDAAKGAANDAPPSGESVKDDRPSIVTATVSASGAAIDITGSTDPTRAPKPALLPSIPRIDAEDDEEFDPTKVGEAAKPNHRAPTQSILRDEDATVDEPTLPHALILVTGMGQTDKGKKRKRNEDAILAMPDFGLFAVADGMGGYKGGDIASALAAKTIEDAYRANKFDGPVHDWLPKRASELARAIQMANAAIFAKAATDKGLEGMGTTVCASRFSPNKERLYIGHVGDSRMYRFREGALEQLTKDHVMEDLGITGAQAAHLSRAVGIWPEVHVDILLCKPRPGDLYLLCSDGLTKMVDDSKIQALLAEPGSPQAIVDRLIEAANKRGGADNISVILIRVVRASESS